MGFNQMMRRMQWLTFARLSNPSLIRRFYANLSKPHKHRLDLIYTLKGINIEFDPSTMCRILGLNNDGDEVYDSNNWPIFPKFDAKAALKRICKPDFLHPKPKSKDLTLQARLLLIFVHHNILPRDGHRSEPSYMDLWLVNSILFGRKVNLGFLIIQHMTNIVLISTHSVLPYDMLLTTVFQHFDIDLDGETDIKIGKTSDAIDHSSISQLWYELEKSQWVLKTLRVPTVAEDGNDEEVAMDIPPPSPSAAHFPTDGVGFSAALFNYASTFQNLSERLDTISLDV